MMMIGVTKVVGFFFRDYKAILYVCPVCRTVFVDDIVSLDNKEEK